MRFAARMARILGHVEGGPTRVAAAFGIGVFLAFFPALGIHTVLALGIALIFRLNKVAVLLGAWINNPWTIAPLYTAGTLVGCALLGIAPAAGAGVDWSLQGRAFYASLVTHLRPLVWPFVVGNLVLGAGAGLVAFAGLRALLVRRRRAAGPSQP